MTGQVLIYGEKLSPLLTNPSHKAHAPRWSVAVDMPYLAWVGPKVVGDTKLNA